VYPQNFLETSDLQKMLESRAPYVPSGHRLRLKNRRSQVRIPPGCKVCIAVVKTYVIFIVIVSI
jgi:hypothetical protein